MTTTLILTPTARLALAERQRLALAAKNTGQSSWQTPQVLAISSWINSLIDQAFVRGDDSRIPINPLQARVHWQSVINHDVFIGEPRVAEMAQAAWRLIHEFELTAPDQWPELPLSTDNQQFKQWAQAFVERCRELGMADSWQLAARLPQLLTDPDFELPASIRLVGFELAMPPLQQSLLDACRERGVEIQRDPPPSEVSSESTLELSLGLSLLDELHSFPDVEEELKSAARWARDTITEKPETRLAIVVPQLRAELASAERVFREVFDPRASALLPASSQAWHVSLGPALSDWALVSDALALLQIEPHRLDQSQAEVFWQSPYLSGAEPELIKRAEAKTHMARRYPWWVHAGQVGHAASDCGASELASKLRHWDEGRKAHRRPALASVWIERFQTELNTLGFAQGRSLDSREYQVLQRFHEVLESFSALDLVIEEPLARSRTVSLLREMCSDISFRERNPGAAVEILGVEEALGSRFDVAWFVGLDEQAWPGNTQRDPFLPRALQAKLPSATAEACLARAQDQLRALSWIAPERRGSFSRGRDEPTLSATRLLKDVPIIEHTSDADSVNKPTDALEWIQTETQGPGLQSSEVHGGTRVLQDQSDCPFRAFANHRLGAVDITPPRPGLDARTRGTLIHKVLEGFWTDLPDQAALAALSVDQRHARLTDCIAASLDELLRKNPLLMSPAERALEAECLFDTLERWLEAELKRAPFAISALEAPVTLQFAGLRLQGKIDRIDSLADDGQLIIDYKTGQSGSAAWAPEARIKDVQLPAYVAGRLPVPTALAFAKLRPDGLSFDGLAQTDTGITGIKIIGKIRGNSKLRDVESWDSLMADWHFHLEQLADGFETGTAAVDPRDTQVCQYCNLHALCRINDTGLQLEADDDV